MIHPTTYEQDQVHYNRITSVLEHWPNPNRQEWRESVGKARANRELKHSQNIGKLVDQLITEMLLTGKPCKSPHQAEARQALRGFGEWFRLNPIGPVVCQQTLLDEQRKLGGTPDCLTTFEGFDWKTSGRLSFTSLFQIDQYWRLASLHGYRLQQYRLVRFDKILGIWEERVLHQEGIEWEGYWFSREWLGQVFDHLLQVYRAWQQSTGQVHDLSVPSNAPAN